MFVGEGLQYQKDVFVFTRARMGTAYTDRDSQADLNNDRVVNMNDLAIFAAQFGKIN